MHRITGVVIVSCALMRSGRMVITVREDADMPYQRKRQQEQRPDGHHMCPAPWLHGRKSTTAIPWHEHYTGRCRSSRDFRLRATSRTA
jgi:hypothetical protein